MKPNCYTCVHRRNVPGDAHSSCAHPDSGSVGGDLFGGLVAMFDGSYPARVKKMGISANSHGVKMGWFYWPANFDPCWLITCNGHTEK